MELRNRILMAPMGDCLGGADGAVSETQAAYFEARARGGAALLLVGSVAVTFPQGRYDARQTTAGDDAFVPGLAMLADRVHGHGARIAAQLVHNGMMALHDVEAGRPMLVPAIPKRPRPDRLSAMVTEAEMNASMGPYLRPTSKVDYRVAAEADLAEVVEWFAAAAERCVRAGFDGVELHAGHGYLIDEFLSPAVNTRSDGWGGSVGGRARLLCEVLGAIRARVGSDLALWIRINALEHHKSNGERFEEQLEVIDRALAAGIDAVHVTAYASTDVATGPTDSYAPHVVGDLAEYAAVVRARVDVPVITFGRFEPDEAEQVLAAGGADFVAMGRKLLADPDLPAKLAAGRVDEIRPCIYQYRCIGNIFVRDSLRCVANAATGREDEARLPRTDDPRRVLVIGAGPGGLETARLLAGRGHHVELREASERLGGVLALAGRADPVLDRYLAWLIGAVERAGVEIRLDTSVSVDTLDTLDVELVVVATGGEWRRPGIPGDQMPHVHTVPELGPWLHGDAPLGSQVVVLGGGKPGLSLAAHARAEGASVTVVEPSAVFGTTLGLPGRWRLVADLETAGVAMLTNAVATAITADAVRVRTADEVHALPADAVIVAAGPSPARGLLDAFGATGARTVAVGDCIGPSLVEGANLQALELARAFG